MNRLPDADAEADRIRLREPVPEDGAALWRLAAATGVLDVNSPYAYLLWGREFADTSVVAERSGAVVGFMMGFRPPRRPDTLFVWQVAVSEAARGAGLGFRMLREPYLRLAGRDLRWLEATVTPSNEASRALFRGFARRLDVPVRDGPGIPAELFPEEGHEPEDLFRIGPVPSQQDAPRTEIRT